MANEITYASLADSRTQETLAATYALLLAERTGAGALLAHPAIRYIGSVTGSGSSTKRFSFVGLDGLNLPASDTEIGALGNTVITDEKVDITVAAFRLHRRPTDLAAMTDSYGVLTPARLAQDLLVGAEQRRIAAILALSSGYSEQVGTTNTVLSLGTFMAAQETLNVADNDGETVAILHSRQWADLKEELASISTGVTSFLPATAEMVSRMGRGYVGRLYGTDIYVHNRVPLANTTTDRRGVIMARDAVLWADGTPPIVDSARQFTVGNLLIDLDRDPREGTWMLSIHDWFGVAEGLDKAGVGILSKNG
jgi:hypothetical protein